MAKFDYGGGCPCGLYRTCIEQCEHYVPSRQEKVVKTMNEVHDFGFTFADEQSYTKVEKIIDHDKLLKLRSMIMPLLLNLKKSPEKDIIQWPGKDRVRSIDDFIKRMDDLISVDKNIQ